MIFEINQSIVHVMKASTIVGTRGKKPFNRSSLSNNEDFIVGTTPRGKPKLIRLKSTTLIINLSIMMWAMMKIYFVLINNDVKKNQLVILFLFIYQYLVSIRSV